MSKVIKITTDRKISIIDLDMSNYRKIQAQFGGGLFELVKTQKMFDYFRMPVVMLVDEEGLLKSLPINLVGCYFYDSFKHGNPIVGDILLCLRVGCDLEGFSQEQAWEIKEQIFEDFEILEEE